MKRETAQRHSLKIIAIFFAVSLWFYVLNSEAIQVERKLTINYIVPKGFAIASLNEKEITLKLKGSKAFIQNIFSNKEKLNIDLNPYFVSSGKNFKVRFYASDINVPFGVEILDISPKETNIELDRMAMMELPITIQYIGDAPKDRKVKEIKVEPKNLAVSGPIEILKMLSKIDTVPINLAMFNSDSGVITVAPIRLDSRLNYTETPKVKITYKTQLIITKHPEKK